MTPEIGFLLLLALAVSILDIFAAVKGLGRPFQGDEVETAYAVDTILRTGHPLRVYGGLAEWIPPVFFYFLAPFSAIMGFSPVSVRLPGIVCLVLTFWTLRYLIHTLVPRDKRTYTTLIAYIVFFSSPAIMQGSQIAEADTTLLSFCSALLIVWAMKGCMEWKLGGIFVVTLLLKPTTTLAFIPCYGWKCICLHGALRGFFRLFVFSTLCATAFWVGLIVVSHVTGCDPFAPFRHNLGQFGGGHAVDGALAMKGVKTLVALYFWLSPFWFLLFGALILESFCDALRSPHSWDPRRIPVLYALTIVMTYLIFGEMTFGYPRYFFSALTLLPILFAVGSADVFRSMNARTIFLTVTVWSAVIVAFVWNLGDPLHLISIDMRSDLVFMGKPSFDTLLNLFISGVLPLIAGGVVWWGVHRFQSVDYQRAFRMSAMTGLIVMNCLMIYFQARAGYATGYNYGAEGEERVISLIRPAVFDSGKSLLAPIDITYMAGGKTFIRGSEFWENPDRVLNTLRERHIEYVVLGIRTNTVSALRTVQERTSLQKYLAENYDRACVGNYYVWKRRER